jgi:hypothetical protein
MNEYRNELMNEQIDVGKCVCFFYKVRIKENNELQ